jgi:threonine 3-dehydrogenase
LILIRSAKSCFEGQSPDLWHPYGTGWLKPSAGLKPYATEPCPFKTLFKKHWHQRVIDKPSRVVLTKTATGALRNPAVNADKIEGLSKRGREFLMAETMLAVLKPEAKAGAEIRDVAVPKFGPTEVLVKVKVASICGTDLHIYNWDSWAQKRIHPPLIPGHEFCGTVVAVGDEVSAVKEGDFVSAEMHVACGKCLQCRTGEAHICQFVKIIGVDTNGAFAEYVVIPESNIWKLDPAIPVEYASILDPLGNAVHTVLAGEIAAKTVAITGCGPIGLFAIAVARAVGATTVFAIEVNEHRRSIAKQMKADYVLDPSKQDVASIVMEATGGIGADVVLEMAGHPDAIRTAFDIVRRGGRISLLGLTSKPISLNFSEDIIFKGITVQGINGRHMYQTWYQMTALLKAGKLDLHPVITDRLSMRDFSKGMERLKTGEASKILLYPNGLR